MSQRPEFTSQFKDQLFTLPNGDLIYELMETTYKIAYVDGYEDAKQTYEPTIEKYKKLVELLKK